MALLTKSRYMTGLKCPQLLWIGCNEKERLPAHSEAELAKFEQGHIVGELAKQLYPRGIDIPTDPFMDNIRETKALLTKGKPLFEAGIMAKNLFSRADILVPAGGRQWDVVEVKSSTQVKDEHLHDLSFQKYCYTVAGLKIRKCFLCYLNKDYVKRKKINPKKLFFVEDITPAVNKVSEGVGQRVKEMLRIIKLKECPKQGIGEHCHKPHDCRLGECFEFLPNGKVLELYNSRKKGFELIENGTHLLEEIPEEYKLTPSQQIQRECARTKKPHINKKEIQSFLKKIRKPVYYLDFETFQTAAPVFEGTRPWQQIPFQFSLHIDNGKKVEHISFLAKGKKDPRKAFLKALKKALGTKGSIIVYNQTFEKMILRELARDQPKCRAWVKKTDKRIIDLMEPFRKFYYYSPKQCGSASIKKVLPTLTGKGYDKLEINNGGSASVAFMKTIFEKPSKKEVEKIRENLEQYCGLDTEGMVWIVEELWKMCK